MEGLAPLVQSTAILFHLVWRVCKMALLSASPDTPSSITASPATSQVKPRPLDNDLLPWMKATLLVLSLQSPL